MNAPTRLPALPNHERKPQAPARQQPADDPRDLSGVHRAIAAKVVKQMEADAQVAGARRRT
jgi:hypothetical protein